MKLHLVIFLATVLLRRISSQCIEDCPAAFKGNLVCAYINGCYLDMEYCSMLAFNCGRHAQSKHSEDTYPFSSPIITTLLHLSLAFSVPVYSLRNVWQREASQVRNYGFLISSGGCPYLLIDDYRFKNLIQS
ncbi:uncharacterized protein LOC110189529 isoform X1 [Drosophila serrata]|uniref:uncharacterized protein LOC110189529 isoform X1 n=1 Tax=Drosophila serrata TaxID=7274 RepID=UPI000A1CF76D|nr:uncharacterized protein LOC110189529 isoform X1 [Drosophila serrata]